MLCYGQHKTSVPTKNDRAGPTTFAYNTVCLCILHNLFLGYNLNFFFLFVEPYIIIISSVFLQFLTKYMIIQLFSLFFETSLKWFTSALQSLTGKVQVFYRDLPVKYSTLTCFGSVQGLKGQISLKYREIYAFY